MPICDDNADISVIRGCNAKRKEKYESESDDSSDFEEKSSVLVVNKPYDCPGLKCEDCDPAQFEPILSPGGTIVGRRYIPRNIPRNIPRIARRGKVDGSSVRLSKFWWIPLPFNLSRMIKDYGIKVYNVLEKTYQDQYTWGLLKCLIFFFASMGLIFAFSHAVQEGTLRAQKAAAKII